MEIDNHKNVTYGQCRFCLARGHHRDLMIEYFFNGIREVYSEIFSETFNFLLSNSTQLTNLICSTCIHRLRDATSFRMMAMSTERQLLEAINTGNGKNTEFVDVLSEDALDSRGNVKTESQQAIREETAECRSALEIADNGLDISDYLSDNECENSFDSFVDGEAELLARFKDLQPLPTKASLVSLCPEFCKQLLAFKDSKVLPQTISKLVKDYELIQESRIVRRQYVTEKLAHIVNATTVLECSNVTPFRSKSRQGFPCFYCRHLFESLERLKEHTAKHKTHEILKVLRTYGAESLVVYVDITNLKCKICNKDMPNLNELKHHLINVHKKKMHLDFTDRIIPYKLCDSGIYECQMCGFSYETFGAIERHMNVHFRNYVCKDCGTGFVTRYRLKVHVKSMHIDGTHPCEVCGKIFSTPQKHKNHVNTVHKLMKRFKCTKCPERFGEYFRRQKHMVQVHGLAPLRYKCNVCEKSFDRRYTLSRHMKRDHLEERDYQCELCSYKCFTKNELRVHMVKHNGERIYECSVCKKAYARKKTLKEHMRIHNNDRRFACAVCGQAFVQKCSLKGHLKTHHLEYSM
ncbi:unnamed protein product [Arctia plantaginis]|uniref:Uncharacterized protein n=1 Tax=Arctia plantaginis TaxID=874455 RepID=A0A8S1BPW8_ARCPL|nr:unnamed protein product [Arctia plantaginis]